MRFLYAIPRFLADVSPSGTEGTETTGSLWDILLNPMTLMLVVMFVAMYFLMIRPENKRKKAAIRMRDELIVGDEVTTTAGIIGKIVSIKDDTITIETGGDKTRIKFLKGAVTSKTEVISD